MKNKLILGSAFVALGLAGCANVGTPDETGFLMQKDFIAGKTFVITHLNDKLLDDTLNATMNFDNDNMISGRGFCNLYRGDYEVSYNNLLEIDDTIFTSRACEDINMNADRELGDVLSESITVSKSTLGYKLTSEKGSFDLMEIQLVVKP